MPPGINLLLILVSLLIIKKYHRGAISLLIFSVVSLLLLSLPFVSHKLLSWIEPTNSANLADIKSIAAEKKDNLAIVVLSAGRTVNAIEYGNIDTVNPTTLERLNYASWLQKKLNVPLLLSGGSQSSKTTPDAVLMNQTMIASYSVIPSWLESESKNIAESASMVAAILAEQKISNILLITHATEMQRTSYIFRKQGLNVFNAPIGFSSLKTTKGNFSEYIPDIAALLESKTALTEACNFIWYKIRY